MKPVRMIWTCLLGIALLISGCSSQGGAPDQEKKRLKVGIMLSDVGLGDQSFSDAAFTGLMQAQEDLDIFFDYRELADTTTYEQGLTELVEEGNDLVIGLGFMVKDSLESIASQYPDTTFLLIDEVSEQPNIISLTFKEDEGSYLAGVVAGMKTKSNVVGFIGGVDVPIIRKFETGYIAGVKASNPNAKVVSEFAGDFGKADLGAQIAGNMFEHDQADIIYAAAGFTGIGALEEAEKLGKLAIGVDTDQFFLAEKAVLTSMLKNVDVAIYSAVKTYQEQREFSESHLEFGLQENGIGLAPVRVVPMTKKEEQTFKTLKQQLLSNGIQ
ncbi:BMP family lipoprotein [Cohnella terricola]|uniref:BMP family ABC transporter substrate-binding protein n=1 Tax=Cohnella terricola TaxID=1289167 RepID=A0A559J9X9_9BACL|nr:BMP family ABC transporter substrate-binding protein [Cohnella terricola]TVX96705.1 BMP family ABC transporter substrate-binding protein [Cohnella terricola]